MAGGHQQRNSNGKVGAYIAAATVSCAVAGMTAFAIGAYSEVTRPTSVAIWLPAVLCGLVTFGIAVWRIREGEPAEGIWSSIKDAWDEFDP